MGKRSDRQEALRRLAALDTPEGAAARRMLHSPPKWNEREDRPAQPLRESGSARLHAKTFRGFKVNLDFGDFSIFGNDMRGFNASTKEGAEAARDMADAMAAAMGLGKCPRCGRSTFNNDVCGMCAKGYGPKGDQQKQRRNRCWKCTQPLNSEICPTCHAYNGLL